jgi:hypothetical protein
MSDQDFREFTAGVISDACHQALQALRQSTAVIELLIAKGVLTSEEVDAQMRLTQEHVDNLKALGRRMDHRIGRRMSDDGVEQS